MSSEIVFHYTNLHAFKNIIETGEIWFTRIDCLNDYSEFNYYKDVFNKARIDFIYEHKIIEPYDLGIINMWADEKLINNRDMYYKKTFIFSLSNQGNSIPMWNYYSDKLGIAIGFNRDLLISGLSKRIDGYYAISPCNIEYNREKQLGYIKSRLDEILRIANKPEFLIDSDIHKTLKKVNDILGIMWYESHMFKEKSFEYENEFRIALCKLDIKKVNNELDKVHSIITGNNIKPVIKIKIAENWNDIVTNIIVSPFNQSDKIVENIHDFLLRNQININENMIEKSKCPVRDF